MFSVNGILTTLYNYIPSFLAILLPFMIACAILFYEKSKVFLFNQFIKIPHIQHRIDKKREELRKNFRQNILNENRGLDYIYKLPAKGYDYETVNKLLKRYKELSRFSWNSGAVSGCVYRRSSENDTFAFKVFELFRDFNPLHFDVFPGTRKMEAEIVRMVASMYNGDDSVIGTVTSGGTESLMLAVKTYRDMSKEIRGVKFPEVIMPVTAHPAIQKACYLFDVKVIVVEVDSETKKVKPSSISRNINNNTCAIFISAPNYPYGVIDPVDEISKICRGVPIHVDACLGSFVVPFLDNLPTFDFRVKDVTSISCDTHKYGLAPKGTSVILYRNEDIFRYQIFSCVNWPGGIYATPSFAGSRSGFLSAACWTTMVTIGLDGYKERAVRINKAANQLAAGWSSIEGMKLLAEPEVCLVAASCKHPFRFTEMMKTKGWCLNNLQKPSGFHFTLTELHTDGDVIQKLVNDSDECVKTLNTSSASEASDVEVLYNSNVHLPDNTIVANIVVDYILSQFTTDIYQSPE